MINTKDVENSATKTDESYEIIEHSDQENETDPLGNGQDKAFISLDQRDLELEILSNIDPNDEFLQSEKSFSLIDGVSVGESDYSILSHRSSEFSIISGSKIHSVLNSSLLSAP